MANNILTKLKKLKPKISWKYLIFVSLISGGCLYHVVQVSLAYFEFETKIDFSIDKNDLTIPMVSFCRLPIFAFRSQNYNLFGITSAQFYNNTYNFGEIFLFMKYYFKIKNLKTYLQIFNFTKHEQLVQ